MQRAGLSSGGVGLEYDDDARPHAAGFSRGLYFRRGAVSSARVEGGIVGLSL